MPPSPTPAYIPLRSPHSDLCLTTFLLSDAPQITRILNEPSVFNNLSGPPFPYSLGMAEEWIAGREGRTASGEEVGGFSVLRPIKSLLEDDEPVFIGTITLSENPFLHISDSKRRAKKIEENAARSSASLSSKDGGKSWALGYYLDPSWSGKGVMSTAVKTYLFDHIIPSQRIHPSCIISSAFTTNPASLKVQLSSSFQVVYLSRSCVKIPKSKGGGKHDLWCTAWVPEGETLDEEDWVWDGGEGLEKLSLKDLGW
ncbi:hypothetical protein BDY24DRAFT_432591 [Mrakia frigida]|uniref:GNAT family N-acetyltransferase n=1 Tax=Mrakia frigida TaxID=29902 RepID=UPI003FCC2273